ncbi:hypothetical protein K7432_018048 [Basidiobolus ranarum]|uniref:Chitin-binding type-3 domain-containing protein n=1 Tax=Basidiobolus ranarum TaxID=34480 RepID=A0ABR2WCM2_9FUNG
MYWDMSHDSNDELLNVLQGVRCTGSGCPSPSIPPVTTSTAQATSSVTSKTSSTVATGSTSTASVTPTSVPGICNGVAEWVSATAYTSAQKVTYKGHLWQAKWWTQNDTPGSNSQSVWNDIGAC